MSADAHAVTTAPDPDTSKRFWKYWSASAVSQVGDAVTMVALPLVAVETLHATSVGVSLTVAASSAAWLVVGLPAGVIVQRFPLRTLQVTMDLTRMALLLSIPVAAWLSMLTLAQVLVVAFVIGIATVLFDVANSTFLPSIVTEQELMSRNSLMSGTSAVTQLGGPALGGVLVVILRPAVSLFADAVSYLLSAVLLRSLPPAEQRRATTANVSARRQIIIGWRFVIDHPVLGPCLAAATLINFVAGALLALTPLFLVRMLDTSAGLYGVLVALEGIGSLVGAAITSRLAVRFGTARTACWSATVAAASLLLVPLAGPQWQLLLFAVGTAGFAGGVVIVSILARTNRQTVTPRDLLPRVMAVTRFTSWGAIPVGAFAAGLLANGTDARTALWVLALLAFAAPAVLFTSRVGRQRDLIGVG